LLVSVAMEKKVIIFWCLAWIAIPIWGQTYTLTEFNTERLQRTERSMKILGAWATLNIAGGALGMARSSGEQKAFHQMNFGWGLVNLGLAASGWYTASHSDPSAFSFYQTTLEHHRIQKILLFNTGLDVAYVAGGFWMIEKSKTTDKNPERWKGFGKSLILQGAFLFAFDLGASIYHIGLERHLPPFFEHTNLGFDGRQLDLIFNF
jgi:hypothetical protein